jgi:hypothetical protein
MSAAKPFKQERWSPLAAPAMSTARPFKQGSKPKGLVRQQLLESIHVLVPDAKTLVVVLPASQAEATKCETARVHLVRLITGLGADHRADRNQRVFKLVKVSVGLLQEPPFFASAPAGPAGLPGDLRVALFLSGVLQGLFWVGKVEGRGGGEQFRLGRDVNGRKVNIIILVHTRDLAEQLQQPGHIILRRHVLVERPPSVENLAPPLGGYRHSSTPFPFPALLARALDGGPLEGGERKT